MMVVKTRQEEISFRIPPGDEETHQAEEKDALENAEFLPSLSPVCDHDPTPSIPKWRQNRWAGILLALCSGFAFACTGLIVKYLKGVHVLNLCLFRFSGMIFLSLPFVLKDLMKMGHVKFFEPIWPLHKKKKGLTFGVLFARALVGFAAVTSHFLAIQRLPVADAMVIGSCSTVLVALVAHIFLREACGVFPLLSGVLVITGVTTIVRPPFLTGEDDYDLETVTGAGFALSRMFCTSMAIVFTRYLKGVNASFVTLFNGSLQLLQNVVAVSILGVFQLPPFCDTLSWGLLLLLGGLSFLSQITLTLALQCEQAGPITVIRSSGDTIFAFILQFIVLSIVPDLFSTVGTVIILTAVTITVFRKWVSSLPEDNENRQKYAIFLK